MYKELPLDSIARATLSYVTRYCNFIDRLPPLEHVSGMDRLKILSAKFDPAAGLKDSLALDLDTYKKRFIRPVAFDLTGQIEDIYEYKPLRFSVLPNTPSMGHVVSVTFDSMAITLETVGTNITASMSICIW